MNEPHIVQDDYLLFFDTETTGLPVWKEPSTVKVQPHLVQLAAILVEEATRNIVAVINLVIRPDGWEIPKETIDVHGITEEYARKIGAPEMLAVQNICELAKGRKRIAFNTTFDNRIIRIATKRYLGEEAQQNWHQGNYDCAMIAAKKAMSVSKYPKLTEAYQHYMNKELEHAHDAMSDTLACMEVYFAMMDQGTTAQSA